MDDTRQQDSGAVLAGGRPQPALAAEPSWLVKAVYSGCSGAIATVVGAAASLVVSATDRVTVWCAVTGAVSVGAGLVWHSGLVSACWQASSRWLATTSSS